MKFELLLKYVPESEALPLEVEAQLLAEVGHHCRWG
jgi:hypothetical protein